MVGQDSTPETPLQYDANGGVIGDRLPAEAVAPHVVAEVAQGLLAGQVNPVSPSLDLYLNPPAAPASDVPPTPVQSLPAVIDPLSLDIDRPPENRRVLPNSFYAKRARPIRITEITTEQLLLFLEQLEKLGLWEMAAARAGLNRRVIDKIRKFDADFKEACDRAMAGYVDTAEKKITDRAIDGWDEPQWSHKTGIQLGTVRKFDSRLAELVLKRLNPGYREKFEGEVKVTGGVMVVPGRASSVEDFMKLQQMPDEIIDAEVTPVKPQLPG